MRTLLARISPTGCAALLCALAQIHGHAAMDLRNNTIFGWVLGAGIVALGATSVTGLYFKSERPEKLGYEIAGVAAAGEDSGPPLEALLAQADIAAGEASFGKCVACHSINAGGANGIGPNLHGIMAAMRQDLVIRLPCLAMAAIGIGPIWTHG
jgi:cytochrome c553